eukprot:Tamp_23252.p1 GENE.Tamp_23252~~Tamp_23252.p1  ORF type:complete len:319 (+),score=22.45 Tamp_23252:88-1044(+)
MCACGPPRMRSNSMAAAYNFELMSIIMIDAHRQLPASACTQACMHGRTRAHTHAHAHVCTQAHTHAPHAPRHVRLQVRTHAPSPTQTLSHNRTANRTDCHEPPGEDVASRLQEFNETPPPNVMQTLVCTATAVFFMFLSIFLRRIRFILALASLLGGLLLVWLSRLLEQWEFEAYWKRLHAVAERPGVGRWELIKESSCQDSLACSSGYREGLMRQTITLIWNGDALEEVQISNPPIENSVSGLPVSTDTGIQPPSAPRRDDSIPEDSCVICMSMKASNVVVPCGHRCVCDGCSRARNWQNCPICRQPVEQIIKVYGP